MAIKVSNIKVPKFLTETYPKCLKKCNVPFHFHLGNLFTLLFFQLMKFQNKRGGRVVLQAIQKPSQNEWGTGLDAMRSALELGKSVNQSLIDLHNVGVKHCDEHLAHFVKGKNQWLRWCRCERQKNQKNLLF